MLIYVRCYMKSSSQKCLDVYLWQDDLRGGGGGLHARVNHRGVFRLTSKGGGNINKSNVGNI
jgi:hypothetical protein